MRLAQVLQALSHIVKNFHNYFIKTTQPSSKKKSRLVTRDIWPLKVKNHAIHLQ
jgi:hypothetical protein